MKGMRCHVIMFVLILESCLAAGNSKPNLEEVYDKLATVTRITNAIVLQSEGLRRNLNVREVIVETLGLSPREFSSLLEIDSDKLSSSMTDLMNRMKKLNNDVKEQKWKDLAEAGEWIQRLSDTKEAIQNVRNKFDGGIGEKVILGYFNFVYDEQNDVKMVKNMTTNVLSNWNTLKETHVTDPDKAMTIWRAEMQNINLLLSKVNDLNTLLKDFYLFTPTVSLVSESLDGLQWFNITQTSKLVLMKSMLEQTYEIWKNPYNSERVGGSFNSFVEEASKISETIKKSERKWTIGFPDRNMSKVKEDLDSNWFRQKVANGSGVEELRKELSEFFELGELVETAEKSWTSFGTELKESPARDVSTAIGKIENYTGGWDGKSLLRITEANFKTSICNLDFSSSPSFDAIRNAASFSGIRLQKLVENILQEEPKKAFIEELRMIQDNQTITAAEVMDEQKFKAMHKMMGNIKDVEWSLKDFVRYQNNFSEKFINKKDEVLKNTTTGIAELLKFGKCIDNYVINTLKLTELRKIIEFFKNVESFLKLPDASNVLDVIQKFVEFKNMVLKAESFFENMKSSNESLVFKLENPEELLIDLGRGMNVLRDIKEAFVMRDTMIASTNFSDDLNSVIEERVEEWTDRKSMINKLIEELESLDKFSAGIKDEEVLAMRGILNEAANTVHGFPEIFHRVADAMADAKTEVKFLRIVYKFQYLNLDFASHRADLITASIGFEKLQKYLDEIFKPEAREESNYIVPISICIGIFLLILMCFAVMFWFTETGHNLIKNWYLSHFAKPEDFEKRWRYSHFLDRKNGKNSLIEAVHSNNTYDARDAVMDGAYINVYDVNGNTPLHTATKRGNQTLVEMLIKNGADRTCLNAQNKTPQECMNYVEYSKIEKIYKKYRNKTFRPRFPQEFPPVVFRIHIDKNVVYGVAERFRKRFEPITTSTVRPTITTHWIVRTDWDGILEIDTIEMVYWITSGVIIVKTSWLEDCVNNERLIDKDCDYLVKKVKYNGVVYDTVIPWAQAMAKGEMPYLIGVLVCIHIPQHPDLKAILQMISIHGGMYCMPNDLPEKSFFVAGARPYLHAHLGPVFILHDGIVNVDVYRADPEVYTLFTDVEFAAFMLMRGIYVDTRDDPISLSLGLA